MHLAIYDHETLSLLSKNTSQFQNNLDILTGKEKIGNQRSTFHRSDFTCFWVLVL